MSDIVQAVKREQTAEATGYEEKSCGNRIVGAAYQKAMVGSTPGEIDELDAALEDDDYKRRYPNDIRTVEQRSDDAWIAHVTQQLFLQMAICPFCGMVPDLTLYGVCCQLGQQLLESAYDFIWDMWPEEIDQVIQCFLWAIERNDSIGADNAAARLMRITRTRNLEDAFVETNLWPTPSCGGLGCFETPTRVWHNPWRCAAVDGSSRDLKAWRDGSQIGPPPVPRSVEGPPRLLEARWSHEEVLLSIERYEAERDSRLEELYGAEVVRLAREAQRAPAAEEKYKRADRSLNQGEEVNDTD